MTRIVVKKIIWDEWNIAHIQKHTVTVEEVEKAVRNIVVHKRAKNNRYSLFCRAGTRIITLIIKREKQSIYYLVTARDAAKKERRIVYEKERKKIT